jgi:hypothetical protein
MKKLKNGLLVIPVPKDAEDFLIWDNNATDEKELEYIGNGHIEITVHLFTEAKLQILGTISKDSCDFDCMEHVQEVKALESNVGIQCFANYGDNERYFLSAFDSFKSMIEAETEYLFENPYELGSPQDFGVFSTSDYKTEREEQWRQHKDIWQSRQDRVIEKLVVIKEI